VILLHCLKGIVWSECEIQIVNIEVNREQDFSAINKHDNNWCRARLPSVLKENAISIFTFF